MVADGSVAVATIGCCCSPSLVSARSAVGRLHAFVDRDTVSTLVLALLAVTAYTLLADAAPLAPLPLFAVIAVAAATFVRAVVLNCKRQCGGRSPRAELI